MDKDFEKWLKQDDLFEYYQSNPKFRKDIFDDYQREKEYFNIKYVDNWLKWMAKNPELAEKKYPILISELNNRIKEQPAFVTANIIQNLPKNFGIWKSDTNSLSGKTKLKEIEGHIKLLEGVLHAWEYEDDIINNAIDSVKEELVEQLNFWKKEKMFEVNSSEEKINTEEVLNLIDNYDIDIAFNELDKLDIQNPIYSKLKKEFTSGNHNVDFTMRLKIFIRTLSM